MKISGLYKLKQNYRKLYGKNAQKNASSFVKYSGEKLKKK